MNTLLLILLVLIGAVIQLISIFIVKDIVKYIPVMKNYWRILGIFLVFFFFGYISYAITLWTGHEFISGDTITSVIFFLGACFVIMVTYMAKNSIKTLQEYIELQKDVITDPLTGIFNRRFIDKQIEHEFNLAMRNNSLFSIVLIDVDHFKKINDTYGHHIGDMVLKRIANILVENVRKSDFVGRFGGEEIVLILPDTDTEGAICLSEKIRSIIAEHPIIKGDEKCGGKDLFCTISMGVATFCKDKHKEYKDLILDADVAMYNAKSSGRNRVCSSCKD
ncbi:MAG: GGDEF domain-containing protein [Thermodesulfovibrionales bacterium]|nr:GGDEF domain-containing protein [Thermodesulfovibrionales bacterium]